MDTLNKNPSKELKSLLGKAVLSGITYREYREMVTRMVTEKTNSGSEKTEALVNYTQLNDRRMKRWDKTLTIPDVVKEKMAQLNKKITWLVLTESWCGDASPSLPVMHKIAALSPNVTFKIIFRDEHPEIMDLFLTNGARSIPKLIMFETESYDVLGEWGPRSTEATKMVMAEKEANGTLSAEFKQDLQVFYNKNKGQDIIKDLSQLLALV